MSRSHRSFAAAVLATLLLAAAPALAAGQDDMQVEVSRSGAAIHIAVKMPVAANARQVWEVLTDYNNMARILPDLESSRAITLSSRHLRLEQTGTVQVGPLRFPFESVRDIELQPYRAIHSSVVARTLKGGYADTFLNEQGGVTEVVYESDSVPAIRLPFGLGLGTVEARTREQFARLREEIYRRSRGGVPEKVSAR
ncbi:hypothetical protein E4K72_19630 [Oxalobacteraceae bacterium OM1]|nr:hypothetical protein E4K72_19630 [Oxalobacteraceae bacterium OM1]